ncbi:GNAT family N-acetyltransferase [Streptomyces sp. NRRL S-495]|uniref:GNAT family N-acetyltransferase n=1 Tax=Streptomyces sp. NRRL S-495 TaxID=1609133 RepID=UPI0005F92604|nr:GNAT family N-acetyltransferase [Streptomyces sp. NRRL S-495]KJY27579.1 GCN5 family acetyltransferase [Streptomyces sp. NRRL S-495]
MNSLPSQPWSDNRPPVVTRVTDTEWHAVEDGLPVGRGDASQRPDGRLFVSVDAWHAPAFDRIAAAMTAALPAPLYAVVDETDHESTAAWHRAGFTTGRREWGYVVPTDPRVTGLGPVTPPAGVTLVPAGEAEEAPLRTLDRLVRAEVEAGAGWRTMPAEVLPRPAWSTMADPSKYAVAREADRYVGMVRVAPLTRQPRIGLIAVLAERQRRGIARALLAHTLASLHRAGTVSAWAEADEANPAATALLESIGARRTGGAALELVRP